MKEDYQLVVRDLNDDSDIEKYKTLFLNGWDHNPYYSYEYLTYFANSSDKLKYFLFKIFDDVIVLMPFILRKVKINNKETPYFDIVSPYGYSGPLFNDSVFDINMSEFWKLVDMWYQENNVVTEFIRFSLNNNHKEYSGVLVPTLKNVKGVILDEEEQWNKFKSKVRNNFRKSTKEKLSLKIYHNPICIDVIKDFYDIYIETMERNNAQSQFFHYIDYFENLIMENPDNVIIAMVYKDLRPISTELILIVKDTIYSYLGGTLSEYFYTRPNDFLKIKMMNWARVNNFKNYMLGGGREDGDDLYKYKKYFFPNDEDVIFYTGRKIINKKVYQELCLDSCGKREKLCNEDVKNNFFPLYRINDN